MSRHLVVNDGHGTRDVLLVGTVAVGRDPSCEISADDPLLSRRHAEFRLSGEGVVLTDLESRNGLRVNGAPTRRAVLRNGDQVQIAGLLIQLVDKTDSSTTAGRSGAAPAASPDDEGTVVLFSPPATAGATDGSGTRPSAPPVHGGARVPPVESGRDPRRPPEPPPPVRTHAPRRSVEPADAEKPAVARSARTSWVSRMYVQVVGLAAFTAILIAAAMSLWQTRTVNAIGVSRATALAHWLAADASNALARGSVAASTETIGREPGVLSALVIGLDGRVLAPASRAGETVATLPGIDTPPSDLYVLKSGRAGGLVHVARPIANAANMRQAVALVTFRPTASADGGNAIVVLGPAFLVALTVALVVAASIRRTTLRGLARFNEDIELAIGGQLDAVKDPLGVKPIRDLADTINYLIARTRAGGHVASPESPSSRGTAPHEPAVAYPEQRTALPSPPRSTPERAAAPPVTASSAYEARIVADSKFRVTEASPECQQMLGVLPKQMIGEHLVQALQSKPLAEAVLTCLGSLPPSGELRSMVRRDHGGMLNILVSRAGKDQPVVITIRAGEARVPA
jgi:hypothetical protein